jgi:hypothetical protein
MTQTDKNVMKKAFKNSEQKSFFDLSSKEIEQLAIKAITQERKRMHDKGLSTVVSIGEKVYKEHPDGTLTLLHG